MYVFRLHIKPGGAEDENYGYSFKYCLKNKLLGVGWTIPNEKREAIDWNKYRKKAIRIYKKIPQVEYIKNYVSKDCLVWVRNSSNEYYLAKVKSPWEYIDTDDARKADITNVFKADIKKIKNPDDVPGKVIASFRASRTIQEVSNENILIYSQLLWNELSDTDYYKTDSRIDNYLDFLTDDEAEDILFIYLQYQGYVVVPNTRKKDTLSYEYYLINKKNHNRAIVQVKTGHSSINKDDYKKCREEVFLFQANDNYEGTDSEHIHIVTSKQISGFINSHKESVPKNILKWFNFVSK